MLIALYVFFCFLLIYKAVKEFSLKNPAVYLLVLIPYFLPGIVYLYIQNLDYSVHTLVCLNLAIIAFFIGNGVIFKRQALKYNRHRFLSFGVVLLVFFVMAALFLGSVSAFSLGKLFKAIGFIYDDIFYPVAFGLISYFYFTNRFYFGSVTVIYVILLLCMAYLASDISRFSFAQLFGFVTLLYFYKFFESSRYYKFYIAAFGVSLATLGAFVFAQEQIFGGDLLILNNVRNVIQVFHQNKDTTYEPFMFFFNSGLVLIPDFLWIGEKPSLYNPSAWYISNVMGADPRNYPWGIGVTGVGASYIYGAEIAVVILFFLLGCFYSFLRTMAVGSFWVGIYIYFLLILPFGAFRMDFSFIIGNFLFTFPLLLFFANKINCHLRGANVNCE